MTVEVALDEDALDGGITEGYIKISVQKVFKHLDKEKNINIAFVSRNRIAELNNKYRKNDTPTDVLSFDYGDEGDIVLCFTEIEKRKEVNEDIFVGVIKTVTHGVLHIFGYDHEMDDDYDIMKKIEKDILGEEK